MKETITLKDLQTGYRQQTGNKVISNRLNATLRRGQLTCLIGPNGTGKSTLLRTIANFQPVLSGDVLLDGRSVSDFSNAELARRLSIVLTDNSHIHGLTTFEVVGMGRSPYTGFWGGLTAEDKEIVERCIEWVGINSVAQQPFETLSDGERQKAMIAKAVAQQTDIILLDEPTAFLYYPNKVSVMLMLRQLAHDEVKTVLLSIHDIDLALQVADQIWMLEPSGNLISGTPQQLCDDGTISRSVANDHIDFNPRLRSFHVKF